MSNPLLRTIPKVDELLAMPQVSAAMEDTSHWEALDAVRQVLDGLRQAVLAGELSTMPPKGALAEAVAMLIRENARMSLRPVINATGVALHTNFGRAPLAEAAVQAVCDVARGYSTLEYNVETGGRGQRHAHVQGLLKSITGAEDAMAVNNNAAAVLLALSAVAAGREVVVSRGELVEIGGAFRVPQVMEQSGAVLREVGTTNKTRAGDYEQAINGETAALMKVHTSNFCIIGFTEEAGLEELAALAHGRGLPLIHDLGSGALLPFGPLGVEGEPTVAGSVAAGADIICFSGDKLMGGPQAGIIIGKAEYIAKMRSHPLARALRIDKLTLAALEATLRLYLDQEKALKNVPTLAMISARPDALREKAQALHGALAVYSAAGAAAAVEAVSGPVGGGSAPGVQLESCALCLSPRGISAQELERRLRAAAPVPIIGRIENDRLILDVRTIAQGDFEYIAARVAEALAEEA